MRHSSPNVGRAFSGKSPAFTLIELLIVVAIIAILAAIAVPNFLEAQTRAKISRVKTDMRSISVGIESYSVDWTGAPLGNRECQRWIPVDCGYPLGTIRRVMVQAKMTTPIAYLTSIIFDVFSKSGRLQDGGGLGGFGISRGTFFYQTYPGLYTRQAGGNTMGGNATGTNNNVWVVPSRLGVTWSLRSIGPSRKLGNGAEQHYLAKFPDTDQSRYPSRIYDSTNGTVSRGYIIRSNKGQH